MYIQYSGIVTFLLFVFFLFLISTNMSSDIRGEITGPSVYPCVGSVCPPGTWAVNCSVICTVGLHHTGCCCRPALDHVIVSTAVLLSAVLVFQTVSRAWSRPSPLDFNPSFQSSLFICLKPTDGVYVRLMMKELLNCTFLNIMNFFILSQGWWWCWSSFHHLFLFFKFLFNVYFDFNLFKVQSVTYFFQMYCGYRYRKYFFSKTWFCILSFCIYTIIVAKRICNIFSWYLLHLQKVK